MTWGWKAPSHPGRVYIRERQWLYINRAATGRRNTRIRETEKQGEAMMDPRAQNRSGQIGESTSRPPGLSATTGAAGGQAEIGFFFFFKCRNRDGERAERDFFSFLLSCDCLLQTSVKPRLSLGSSRYGKQRKEAGKEKRGGSFGGFFPP